MTPHLFSSLSDATRHRLIAACGVVILLLSTGSGLLPVLDNDAGPAIVGRLLIAASLTGGAKCTVEKHGSGNVACS